MILLPFIRSPRGYADMMNTIPLRRHRFLKKECLAPAEGGESEMRMQFTGSVSVEHHQEIRTMPAMTTSELPIRVDPPQIAEYCRVHGIRRLSLFGSVLRDDFDPLRSDVDVLVEYLPGTKLGFNHFGFEEQLSRLFARRVDLCTPDMLSRYFADEVLSTALLLYEQA
jgi:predicted nucleotidyltransferase